MAIRTDHVRITTNDPQPGLHRIKVGDTDISNAVCGVGIVLHPGELPDIRLNLIEPVALAAPVDGAATVSLPDGITAALVALGWTPPAPAVELTPEQQHAEQIIRDLISEAEFDDICDRVDDDPEAVHDLILSATVIVSWAQDGEQAEAGR